MEQDFDFTGETKESLDFFRPTPDWYLATLRGYKTDPKEGFLTFDFRIDGPNFRGATLTERLDNPRYCPNPEWLEMRQRSWKVWADRLIFDGKAPVGSKAKGSFDVAIGKQFVLNVKDASYKNKTTGATVDKVGLDYAPYQLTHEGIPPAVRVALGLALLPGQVLPSGLPKGPTTKRQSAAAAADPAAQPAKPAGESPEELMKSLGL